MCIIYKHLKLENSQIPSNIKRETTNNRVAHINKGEQIIASSNKTGHTNITLSKRNQVKLIIYYGVKQQINYSTKIRNLCFNKKVQGKESKYYKV